MSTDARGPRVGAATTTMVLAIVPIGAISFALGAAVAGMVFADVPAHSMNLASRIGSAAQGGYS